VKTFRGRIQQCRYRIELKTFLKSTSDREWTRPIAVVWRKLVSMWRAIGVQASKGRVSSRTRGDELTTPIICASSHLRTCHQGLSLASPESLFRVQTRGSLYGHSSRYEEAEWLETTRDCRVLGRAEGDDSVFPSLSMNQSVNCGGVCFWSSQSSLLNPSLWLRGAFSYVVVKLGNMTFVIRFLRRRPSSLKPLSLHFNQGLFIVWVKLLFSSVLFFSPQSRIFESCRTQHIHRASIHEVQYVHCS
jgi:hypothetical protein